MDPQSREEESSTRVKKVILSKRCGDRLSVVTALTEWARERFETKCGDGLRTGRAGVSQAHLVTRTKQDIFHSPVETVINRTFFQAEWASRAVGDR
jgi:ribosomal protein L19